MPITEDALRGEQDQYMQARFDELTKLIDSWLIRQNKVDHYDHYIYLHNTDFPILTPEQCSELSKRLTDAYSQAGWDSRIVLAREKRDDQGSSIYGSDLRFRLHRKQTNGAPYRDEIPGTPTKDLPDDLFVLSDYYRSCALERLTKSNGIQRTLYAHALTLIAITMLVAIVMTIWSHVPRK